MLDGDGCCVVVLGGFRWCVVLGVVGWVVFEWYWVMMDGVNL